MAVVRRRAWWSWQGGEGRHGCGKEKGVVEPESRTRVPWPRQGEMRDADDGEE